MVERTPDAKMLEGLQPVGNLDPQKRASLAQRGKVFELPHGEHLEASKEHNWLLYVIQGSVRLVADDRTITVSANSPRGREPLFSEGRLRDQVLADRSARILRIDRRVYDILQKQQSQSSYEVEETELNEAESALFAQIYAASMEGKLELPALPEVAIKIQAAMRDPDVDIKRLANLVSMDIAVTAGLIRAASSAAYGSGNPVKSVRDAIVRLGLVVARRLALTIAMQQVFRSKSRALHQRMRELWDRSVHVSVLSFVLARECAGLEPEQALLAGLLHDVGSLPVLDYIGHHFPDATDAEIDSIIHKLHGVVGEIVLSSWGMDSQMSAVVRESGHWLRTGNGTDKPDYCDVVIIARLYHLNVKRPDGVFPAYYEVPAFARLGVEQPNEEKRLDLIENAVDEMTEMMAVINGKVW